MTLTKQSLVSMVCGALAAMSGPAASAESDPGIDAGALYHDYCSVCHGDSGDGRSRAQQGLIPPPRDFTTPQAAVDLNRERMFVAIKDGVPGTAMTGWKSQLDDEEINAVVEYVQINFMRSAAIEHASPGSRIYAEYCSVCHGDSGEGAMWAISGLSPSPSNFRDPKVKAKLNRERMIKSVTYGRVETAMAGWDGRLSTEDIELVIDYVREAFMGLAESDTETVVVTSGPDDKIADMSAAMPGGLVGDLDRGAQSYMANCATCHGSTGDGRGPRAYFINPKPRNFQHPASRVTFNRPALFSAVAKGKLFSEMPAWDKVLDDQQIADVAEYVFQAFIYPGESVHSKAVQ